MTSSKRRFLIAIPGLVLVFGAALLPFLINTAPFHRLRQHIAEAIIAELFSRVPTAVGNADFNIGLTTRIRITDVRFGSPDQRQTGQEDVVKRLEMSVPLFGAFTHGPVSSFMLQGLTFEFNSAQSKEASDAVSLDRRDPEAELAGLVVWMLHSPAAESMSLRDLTITYRDEAAGWDEKFVIEELKSTKSTDGQRIHLEGAGSVNSAPMSLSGDYHNSRHDGAGDIGPFEMIMKVANTQSTVAGKVDLSGDIPTIDAEFEGTATSLSQLAELYGLDVDFEGRGEATAKLTGQLDELVASDILLTVDIRGKFLLEIKGQIDDLNNLQGLSLNIDGKAPKDQQASLKRTTFLDLDVVGFSGLIVGEFDAIRLDQFVIFSNSLSAEFSDIGPISAARMAKSESGQLKIEGIHVLSGPEGRRTLDLTGRVRDALALDGIDLKGTFDLPSASALSLEGSGAREALGRLAGKLAISSADGEFTIETLEGEIKESELVQLSFGLVDPRAARLEEKAVRVELTIHDLTAFAAALDQEIGKVGAVGFNGQFSLHELAPSLLGSVRVDRTLMVVDLRGSLEQGAPRLDGSVKSKRLYLDDLRGLFGLIRIGSTQDFEEVDVHDRLEEAIRAKIDIDFASIAGAGAAANRAGQIKGTVTYRDGVFLLDPLKATYLGGVLTTNLRTNTKRSPYTHRLKGGVTKLPVGRLLRDMQAPQLVSGSLTLDYELAMSGNTAPDALKTMSGSVSGSIWSGAIETDLLDLSGLNLISWLKSSSKAKGRANLVCARIPVQLNNGLGSTRSMIIETNYVQVVAAGTIDIRRSRVDLRFQPRPKVRQMINIVSPFSVVGPLEHPTVKVEKGSAGRAVAETLALPLNVLGGVLGGKPKEIPGHKPCVIPRQRQPENRRRR